MIMAQEKTTFQKREELSTALKLQKQIDQLYDTLEDLRATGGVKGSALSFSPKSGNSLSGGDMIAELEGNIEKLEQDMRFEAEIIRRKIVGFDLEEREENLLIYRYVRCLRWEGVWSLLGISKTHVHRLENEILSKISM